MTNDPCPGFSDSIMKKKKKKAVPAKKKLVEIVKKPSIWSKIYNASIFRFRVVSLILVIAGVYLVSLGILNISNSTFNLLSNKTSSEVSDDGHNGSIEPTEGSIDEGISTSLPEEIDKASETVSVVSTAAELARAESLERSEQIGVWVATDYEEGDIEKGTYTVVKGDTLWEIAEAVYGNGLMWKQILAANSDSIGFLPNGSQALIFPGQSLLVP